MNIPKKIGNYDILEKVGRGGTADVYKGFQPSLKRWVAVKVLSPEFVNDERVRERFRREKESIASLTHPNIITIYEYFEEDGLYCYVMEFLDAKTVADVIKAEGKLAPSKAIDITLQLLAALEYAHERGIIHRDIKPANLFLDDKGHLKLTDFGLAKQLHKSSDLTQSKSPIGTPYYMAPEQVRGEATDERTDVYQAGVVLYHMLTGRVPFPGRTPYEVTMKCLKEKLAFEPVEAQTLGSSLRAAVVTSTNKKKEERYKSAREFADDLKKIQTGASQKPSEDPDMQRFYKAGLKHAMLVCRRLSLEVPLVKANTFIGRGPGVEVTIPDGTLAPKAAMIRFANGKYTLVQSNRDVGMTVNGESCFGRDRDLEDGDVIAVMGFDILFVDPR